MSAVPAAVIYAFPSLVGPVEPQANVAVPPTLTGPPGGQPPASAPHTAELLPLVTGSARGATAPVGGEQRLGTVPGATPPVPAADDDAPVTANHVVQPVDAGPPVQHHHRHHHHATPQVGRPGGLSAAQAQGSGQPLTADPGRPGNGIVGPQRLLLDAGPSDPSAADGSQGDAGNPTPRVSSGDEGGAVQPARAVLVPAAGFLPGLLADASGQGSARKDAETSTAVGVGKDGRAVQAGGSPGTEAPGVRSQATVRGLYWRNPGLDRAPEGNDWLFGGGSLAGTSGESEGLRGGGGILRACPTAASGPTSQPAAGAGPIAGFGAVNDADWAAYGRTAEAVEGVAGSLAGLCLCAGFLHPRPNSEQFSILVVESDEATRDAMTVRLVHDGYWVLPAATGREAWKLLRAPFSAIDLVVLDGQLADISSVQLCKLLRDRYPHLPVLVYAAPTQTADLTSFGQLGVRHYFRKPVDLERLLQTAEGILS